MTPAFKALLLLGLTALLLATARPAEADRKGWNEPARAPGYDNHGLLRINADYFDLAAATGGDFYFWAPGEFAAAAGLLSVPIASAPASLAYRSGGGDFSQTLEVRVDAAITLLTLFAGAQRLDDVRLLRPDGRSVEANPAGVAAQTYRHMRIVTIEKPEPGLWQVEVRGAGSYSIAVRYLSERRVLAERGLSSIDLIDFAFVEERGRPGHEGLFPIMKPVRAGEERLFRFTLTGEVRVTALDLVSAEGEILDTIHLDSSPELAATDEFIGSCRVPPWPFRALVRGEDLSGNSFQRLTPGLITPAATE